MQSHYKPVSQYYSDPSSGGGATGLIAFASPMVWAVLIFVAIVYFFKLLFAPFKYLLMSDGERLSETIKVAKQKVEKRGLFQERVKNDPENMLNKCLERVVLHPENYPNDPDQAFYTRWLADMKKGLILDSYLMYAPEVYIKDPDGQKMMNPEFLDYLQHQVDLHIAAKFGQRFMFEKSIRGRYPEFSPKLSLISDEIDERRENVTSRQLHDELLKAIEAKDISEELARYIVDKVASDKIKETVAFAQKYRAKGFCSAFIMYCLKTGYSPEHELAKGVNSILDVLEMEQVATAFINGQITADELSTLVTESRKISTWSYRMIWLEDEFRTIVRNRAIARD